jgi:hypothetical protein
MKMTFWDVAPCTLVEVDRRFGGAFCFLHQGDEYEITRRNIPEGCHLRYAGYLVGSEVKCILYRIGVMIMN